MPLSDAEVDVPPARPSRRRRSALREPVLVDRAELQEDAEGRVEIFTIEPERGDAAMDRLPDDGGSLRAIEPGEHVRAALAFVDGWGGRVSLAVVLAIVLIVGLALTR